MTPFEIAYLALTYKMYVTQVALLTTTIVIHLVSIFLFIYRKDIKKIFIKRETKKILREKIFTALTPSTQTHIHWDRLGKENMLVKEIQVLFTKIATRYPDFFSMPVGGSENNARGKVYNISIQLTEKFKHSRTIIQTLFKEKYGVEKGKKKMVRFTKTIADKIVNRKFSMSKFDRDVYNSKIN